MVLSINSASLTIKGEWAAKEPFARRRSVKGRGQAPSEGAIGSGAASRLPNMGSIGELFMDGYIRFGKRSKRLVCEEKPRSKHHARAAAGKRIYGLIYCSST